MYIEKVIDNIKKRPKMYVTEVKIEYIYHYISGYCLASNHFSADDIDKWFCGWFWKWLVKWIEDNIEPEYQPKSVIWYDDIKVIAEKEEKNEVDVFFDLCTLFFDEYKNQTGFFHMKIN